MGQIAYPIDHLQIMGDGENKEARFIQYSDGLRIFVNIGDVDITPSREALSYSKDTKINIKNIVNRIVSEIASKIEDQIQSQPSLYKARIKYVQISDQCSSIKNAIESLQKSISWNGQKLFDNIINESVSVKNKLSLSLLHKSYYRKKISHTNDIDSIVFKSDMNIIIDDLARGGMSRIKQYMRNSQGEKNVYVYKLQDGETIDNNQLYDILGGPTMEDMVLTSTLPKVEYNRTSNGGGDGLPPVQIQVYNEETGQFEDCNMSVKYENAYYFKESKGEATIGSHSVGLHYLANVLTYMHKNYAEELDGMTFYAVKPSVIKNRKLDERTNWADAITMLRNIFSNAVEKHKQDIIDSKHRFQLSEHRNEKFVEALQMCKIENESKKIAQEYNEYEKRLSKIKQDMDMINHMSNIIPMCNHVNFSGITVDTTKFSSKFDKSLKKYPMLSVISNAMGYGSIRNSDAQKVAEYIDTIESNEHMSNVLSCV